MNRKKFFASATALSAISLLSKSVVYANEEDTALPVIPHYLIKGDTIGIVAPAGYITDEEIQPALQKMQEWGYTTQIGTTIGKRDFTFAGTDEERLHDFQTMLDDPALKAIMCARGGYGAVRIIDKLNWEKFKKYPKWIIGFSDATIFHSHINRKIGFASIHSKMCNSFPDDWKKALPVQIDTINSINKALLGERMDYKVLSNNMNRIGTCEGVLVGGNLKTLESLAGSQSDIKTAGKILFVEDTGEYLYSIDRMFWNLKRSGKLDTLSGLIIGGFKIKKDDGDEDAFGKTLEEIVMEKVNTYNYPVCFNFPVGHQYENYALKCGVKHKLIVNNSETILTESR